jgi:hypothetical protein
LYKVIQYRSQENCNILYPFLIEKNKVKEGGRDKDRERKAWKEQKLVL